ncbi:MAG: radical SAM protein [Planctomycetota bacterium]
MRFLYGPVPSWRLGRSLGIDPVSTPSKTCSFDCVYCQLGPAGGTTVERRTFVAPEDLRRELDAFPDVPCDTVTFSGVGEPTLAENVAELADLARARFPERPLAILTNSSLVHLPGVRKDLARFDLVVAKLEAPDEALFRAIHRPHPSLSLARTLEGLRRFREEFHGRLALQIMCLAENESRSADLAALARSLRPDEVYLNTPLRPSPSEPLNEGRMAEIEKRFSGLRVRNVYRARRPSVQAIEPGGARRRRPRESRSESPPESP